MPVMPFEAESLEILRARYHKALEKLWIAGDDMIDRPGLHRENLFDFESGLRLLISKDLFPNKKIADIHVSASWQSNNPIALEDAHREITSSFRALGGVGNLRLVGFSKAGIPHFVVEMVN